MPSLKGSEGLFWEQHFEAPPFRQLTNQRYRPLPGQGLIVIEEPHPKSRQSAQISPWAAIGASHFKILLQALPESGGL